MVRPIFVNLLCQYTRGIGLLFQEMGTSVYAMVLAQYFCQLCNAIVSADVARFKALRRNLKSDVHYFDHWSLAGLLADDHAGYNRSKRKLVLRIQFAGAWYI